MSTAAAEPTTVIETLAELIDRLGDVPLERIRFHPPPGTATERDVDARPDGVKRLCELVDGVLVEKPMGYYESRVAGLIFHHLEAYLETNDLGPVFGADAPLRLSPGLVRLPDVSFMLWSQFSNRELPPESIPDLAPDLAVEVLSPTNTAREMERTLREYFRAGARLAWYVEPELRTIRVYTSPTESQLLTAADTLDGGSLLPGFTLSIAKLFDRAGRRGS